jgi:hypothetical protein
VVANDLALVRTDLAPGEVFLAWEVIDQALCPVLCPVLCLEVANDLALVRTDPALGAAVFLA